MQRYLRIFTFMFQVWSMGSKNKTLFKPILYNIAIAAPVNLLLAFAYHAAGTGPAAYMILALGITALYFIDYVCAGLTVSLIHDEVTQGQAELGTAIARVKRSSSSILLFAAISAAFDILASYTQERDDLIAKILTSILYMVWTTASFMVMPSLVIEGLSFGAAFKRSKEIMAHDPTNVGIGVVGMGAANYVIGAVVFGLAYRLLEALGSVQPLLAVVLFFSVINVYWALSGYLKISYYTCFYMWAMRCKHETSSDAALAPAPLAVTLAA